MGPLANSGFHNQVIILNKVMQYVPLHQFQALSPTNFWIYFYSIYFLIRFPNPPFLICPWQCRRVRFVHLALASSKWQLIPILQFYYLT